MHRARDAAVVQDVAGKVERAAKRQQPALAIRRNAAGDNQPDATPGPLPIKGREFTVVIKPVFQARVHRAHDDAVAQRGETEIERASRWGNGDMAWHGPVTVKAALHRNCLEACH
jgi:hypothetical protein